MRQLKQHLKLADYTGLLEKFSETGAVHRRRCAINAEADRYDKILTRFRAKQGTVSFRFCPPGSARSAIFQILF